MDQKDRLYELAMRAWEFRKQRGFLKALPEEIRREVYQAVGAGIPASAISKAIGVGQSTIAYWIEKYTKLEEEERVNKFSEVKVVAEKDAIEIRITTKVQGCRVELCGSDYSHLERLLRKLGE
jgi:DNA-binding transcriptional ArsR family regulator